MIPGPVHIHVWEHYFSTNARRDEPVAWREGLTCANVIPEKMRGLAGLTVHHNGRKVEDAQLALTNLAPGDHVDVAIRPGEVIVPALIAAAISIAISLILNLILPKPKGPKRRGDEESPTYGWDGKDNVRVEGGPRQIVPGEMLYAPQIIDSFVNVTTVPPQSDLYILMGMGEGPFESIGGISVDTPDGTWLSVDDPANPIPAGILINGNPAENFHGVKAQVRLGTNEQAPIIGFEQVHTVSTVGSTLTQRETTAATNAGTAWLLTAFPYNSNNATVQAVWDEFAQTFDLPSEADSFIVTVGFPQGLFRIDALGNLQDAYFKAFIRYRELDNIGNPIVTGGDNGDGWIYGTPLQTLASHHQSPFQHPIAVPLYSGVGFTPGQQGRILDATPANSYAYTAASAGGVAVNANTPWTTGQLIDAFSVEFWSRSDIVGSDTPLFEWFASNRGIRLYRQYFVQNAGTQYESQNHFFNLQWGDGAGILGNVESISSPPALWNHWVVTYVRSGGTGFFAIYLNGALRASTSGSAMQAPAAPFNLMRTGALIGRGMLDEVRVWSRTLSASDVFNSYNYGLGTFGANSAQLVAGWHFDNPDVLVSYTYSNDYSSRNNDVTTVNGATMGDPTSPGNGSAIVFRPGTGTRKRMRARVQVLRFNLKSTSTAITDESTWDLLDGLLDEQLSYPNTAVLALFIPATDQLNTTQPRVEVLAKGLKWPVWDGINANAPNIVQRWSANPAWMCLGILTNRRWGRGGDFDVSKVPLVPLKEWADHCDEKVYDGLGRTDIHETNTAKPISDIVFDSTLNGGIGGLQVQFRNQIAPPTTWHVGGFVGFDGLPTSGGSVVVNINTSGIDGFEISSIVFNGGGWIVTLIYEIAVHGDPWADGTGLGLASGITVSGTAEGRETRFRYDGVLDTFTKVWDVLLQMAGTARAVPMLEGNRVRFKVSKQRSPVGLVTMASIVPKSFKVRYSSAIERPNAYVADILDRDQGYVRKPVKRSDADLNPGTPEGAFNREHLELQGIVRRSQAQRDLDFRLRVNRLLIRQGSFRTGLEALLYEAGDVVVLGHDMVPWGKSGRISTPSSGTTITFDRQIVLAAATAYYVQVSSAAAGQESSGSTVADHSEVRQITSGAGTYAAGAAVSIVSAFTHPPAKDDKFLVYCVAEQFLAEIAEITLTPTFEREITWIEYDKDIYDVDTLPEDIHQSLFTYTPPVTERTMPGVVGGLTLTETQRARFGGEYTGEMQASWVLDPATAAHVAQVVVWARSIVGEGPWIQVANMSGPASSARFQTPADIAAGTLEIAVQPVSTYGARRHPDRSSRASVTLTGLYVAPAAPSNVRAVLNGELVTYYWDPPASARGLSFELRRGGWLLGDIIGVAPPGSSFFGPTRNWAAGKNNARGDGPPLILVRSRDGRGQYSSAAVLSGFNPAVAGSEVLIPPNVVGQRVNGDQPWEDYGTGWDFGSPAATITNLQVTALSDGRKILEFAGSNLSGSFETAVGTIDADTEPERAYVEVYAVADQVAPFTFADLTLPFDDPRAAMQTFEGGLAQAGCTLKIEWRYKLHTSDAYSDWLTYTPGVYYFLVPQFRFVVTRPDTTWNVKVYRFGTRLSRIAPQAFERDMITDHLTLAGVGFQAF